MTTDSSSGRAWVPWETNETPGAFVNRSVSKVGTKGASVVVIVVVRAIDDRGGFGLSEVTIASVRMMRMTFL
jgi:hypothetical protein